MTKLQPAPLDSQIVQDSTADSTFRSRVGVKEPDSGFMAVPQAWIFLNAAGPSKPPNMETTFCGW